MRRLCVLLGLLALAGPGRGATLTGTVQRVGGQVAGEVGLDAVRIELAPLGGGARVSAACDVSGRFRCDDVPAGDWELAASDGAGAGARRFLSLPAQGSLNLQVRLATARQTTLFSAIWLLVAVSVTGVFGAGIVLYGTGRGPRRGSAPRSITVALLLWCLAFLMFRLLSPEAQPLSADLAPGLSALLAALLSGCVVLVTVDLCPPWQAAAAALASGVLLSLAARVGLRDEPQWLALGLGLLLWTTAAGWLLSLWLRRTSYLVLAAVVVAIADIWSVFFGFSHAAVSGERPELQAVAALGLLPWPVLGSNLVHGQIGMGDVLFLAWFLAAARRFELGVGRNFWLLMGAFTVGITMAQVLSLIGAIDTGLPALPFMSALFLLGNRGRFALPREDRRQMAWVVSVLVLVLGLHAAGSRHAAPRAAGATNGGVATAPRRPFTSPWDPAMARALPVTCEPAAEPTRPGAQPVQLTVTLPDRRTIGGPGHRATPSGTVGRPVVLCLVDGPQPGTQAIAAGLADAGWAGLVLPWRPATPTRPSPFDVTPGPPASPLYDAGLQALAALQWLRTAHGGAPVVLIGERWGGLIALAVAALEPHVAAAVTVDLGTVTEEWSAAGGERARRTERSRAVWAQHYAPERYAAAVHCPVLVAGGTNDSDFGLPAMVSLYEAAAGPKAIGLVPNSAVASLLPASPAGQTPEGQLGKVLRWLEQAARQPRRLPAEPGVVASVDDGDLRLRLPSATRTGVPPVFWVSVGTGGWPGRDWIAVAARPAEDGWATRVAVAAPAAQVAVLVGAEPSDWPAASRPRQFSPRSLGLTLRPVPWPQVSLGATQGAWRPTSDVWRRTGLRLQRDETLGELRLVRPASGSTAPVEVVLETNRIAALSRLGSQAEGIELRLDPQGAAPQVRMELVERSGQVAERRFVASAPLPAGERATVRWPLARFRGPAPGARPSWPLVDGVRLALTLNEAAAPVLRELRLYGPPGGEVREVTER